MDTAKRERLEQAGFRVTTVAEFLGLSAEESELIEIKLAFTYALREQRKASGLSQTEVAERIGSNQSRLAKMEAGDPNVSLDLLIRALLATGMRRDGLADVMAGQVSPSLPAPVSRASLTYGLHVEPSKNGSDQGTKETADVATKRRARKPQTAKT